MEPAEVPVFEEHSPELDVNPMDESLQQPADTPPGGGLALGLPPSSGAAGGDAPARWSLDLNSSTHSDWEVVSAGHHSGCGSSPRSVSLAEAYDSEGEDGARPSGAAALAEEAGEEGQPAAAVPVDAADDPERLPGHPLDPTREHNSAEAAEAAAAAEGEACASSAACDSPRSSFERPLSHAGGDELYSVSQDSDHSLSEDEQLRDLMRQGEPCQAGLEPDFEPLNPLPAEPLDAPPPAYVAPAAAAAAATAAACRAAAAVASTSLRELAASVSAVLARFAPAAADVAQRVARGVAVLLDSLRERATTLPRRLAPLAAAALPAAADVRERVAAAAHRASKRLGSPPVSYARLALSLGLACGGLALALRQSWAEQARLASLLAKREHDLTRLLMKVMELQRNITHRGPPLVRHISTSGLAHASPAWPAIVVV